MAKLTAGRASFREWVDKQPQPDWKLLPLTHTTKGIHAEDILRDGQVTPPHDDELFEKPVSYFFYGRPAYRVSGDGAVKVEAACPYCFIFDPQLIKRAASIFAFDTGAFANRLYKRFLLEEMKVEDFCLEVDEDRPNRLIQAVFETRRAYFDGDTSQLGPAATAEPWEFHARSYIQLLSSAGRNEPDDRICSIEIVLDDVVRLAGNLKAVVVPHTLWSGDKRAPWLKDAEDNGAQIVPYEFIPNRHPEHYHALLEKAVRQLFEEWGML